MQKYFQAIKLKTVPFCIIAALSCFMPGMANAQDKGSNLSLAQNLYHATLDSLFDGMPEPLLQVYDSLSGDAAFIRSGWIRYWASAKPVPKGERSAQVFVIDSFGLTVDYFDDSRRLLGLSGKMKRRFTFFLQGWLEDALSGKVIRSVSVHKINNDRVEAGRLSGIEKSPFPFTKGTMKTKSVWMRYIQPGIVITAVSAIVYLFFSVRT